MFGAEATASGPPRRPGVEEERKLGERGEKNIGCALSVPLEQRPHFRCGRPTFQGERKDVLPYLTIELRPKAGSRRGLDKLSLAKARREDKKLPAGKTAGGKVT